MIVAIAGATGLTGNLCVQQMLGDDRIAKVICIGRRPILTIHKKLTNVLLKDGKLVSPVIADAFICCLGTTIKKAGSKDGMRAIDLELPIYLAEELHYNGCGIAAVVSAMGADAHSTFFYLKTKGQMEKKIGRVGFDSVTILRPALIEGNRLEMRKREKIAIAIAKVIKPLLIGKLKHYRVIKAATIATALRNAVAQSKPGYVIYFSEEIKSLASSNAPILD